MDNQLEILKSAFESGKGVFRLAPNWVPRAFCIPGKRLKLHPDDYYAYGTHRGGIDERWFASTVKADNGPETTEFEGMSFIHIENGGETIRVLLKDAIDMMGEEILGTDVMDKFGGWMMYSKFFDNLEPLPHHMHQDDEFARNVGKLGKPESYYFPKQLNDHDGLFPYTFFGLNPKTTKEEVKDCLKNWDKGDNGILNLSRAYRLLPGTGWDVPPGILHAPGSLLTYEPQRASDVFSMFQSLTWKKHIEHELLVKDVPDDQKDNLDYLIDMLDWDQNVDPYFYENHFCNPKPVRDVAEMESEGYMELAIIKENPYYSAKELTVYPEKTVIIKDTGAYGIIVVGGRGKFGEFDIESPTLIRFEQMTKDELFVSATVARNGITITNTSDTEDLVILKHIGPVA